MEHRAFAALIVRLLGFWQLVVALNAIASGAAYFTDPDFARKIGVGMLLLGTSVQVGIPLLLGWLLIKFPMTVTSKVLRIEGVEPANAAAATLLERVVVSALGMWLVLQAVLDAIYSFSKWRVYLRFFESQYPSAAGTTIAPTEFAGLVTAAFQLALGLWLLLGSRGLVNFIAHLRRT